MPDIIPDGNPVETPELGAEAAYQNIPAGFGQMLGEQIGTTTAALGRVAEQGQYEGSGFFPQLLYGGLRALGEMGEAETGTAVPTPTPAAGAVPSPMLGPEEYNKRFAPIGDDGKPVSLGSQPLPEGVAKLIGEAKHDEIERENVTARFESAHDWPTNFAAGAVGFMLDPLRAATAFVPGIGEEAILARLGTGMAARIGARVAAGAATGAVAQVPLSALEYGLGREEASDYDLRSAFRDMAFAAAGNAIVHAGLGTAAELLHGHVPARPEIAPEVGEAPVAAPAATPEAIHAEAAPIISADAQTQHAAISSSIAQVVEGEPVHVEPLFQLKTPEPIGGLQFLPPPARPYRPGELAAQQRELQADGFAPGVPQDELKAATAEVYTPPEPAASPPVPTEAATPSETQAPAAEATREPALYFRLPKEPTRLINFLRRGGGLQDQGGEISHMIGGVRGRPGLINNRTGQTLDDAALAAWQEGFLPGAARPDINALLDAIREDHQGTPQYSQQDEARVERYHQAVSGNQEIDRLAQDHGIETAGKTAAQFWDEVGERSSVAEMAREAESMGDAYEVSIAEAEARATEWMERHGRRLDDIYDRGEPRTLDDLDAEYREEETARRLGEGAGSAVGPRPAGRGEGALPEGEGPSGGGARVTERAGAEEPANATYRGPMTALQQRGMEFVNRVGGTREALHTLIENHEQQVASLRERTATQGLAQEAQYLNNNLAALRSLDPEKIIEPEAMPATKPAAVAGLPEIVYRGHGRAEQGAIYNPNGVTRPIMGDGRYYAMTRERASHYGPEIEELRTEFQKPLIIRSDQEWRALTQAAGWDFPNPFGRDPGKTKEDVARLNALLKERGYDAVAVLWDDESPADVDQNTGARIKTLRNALGEPQVFVPDWAQKALPATERTEQGMQLVMPGAERSARQAAASREATGRGMIRPTAPQAAPGGMFAPKATPEAGLFDHELADAQARMSQMDLLPEEQAELDAAHNGLREADQKSAAYDEAGACLKDSGI